MGQSEVVAHVLLDAWKQGQPLPSLLEKDRPGSLSIAYEMQDSFFRLADCKRAGWKLGVGSPEGMRKGNLSRPLIGQICQKRCYPSGSEVTVLSKHPLTIECEIAFTIDRDIQPSSSRQFEPDDIRNTYVTFEIVRSRFIDRKAVGWPSFVADNVGFEALVISEPICQGLDFSVLRALRHSVAVSLNESIVSKSCKGDAATDPLNSLAALYQHAKEYNITLNSGDIISTGAMCVPFDIEGTGHKIVAEFLNTRLEFIL